MKYRFILSYKSTDSDEVVTWQVSPLYGDDPNVAIERVNDEWYYTRKLGGKFTFVREDYSWIMAREFDGTYTMTVECSTDGSSWQEYFVGTFSRASLTIDEDNRNAVLDGLSEGTYNVIENAKDTEYDLRKVIPDTEAKEVQGEIWPALALVDYRQANITKSDIYCNGASVGGGYDSKHPDSGFKTDERVVSDSAWRYVAMCGEGYVKMKDASSEGNCQFGGVIGYMNEVSTNPNYNKTCVGGTMQCNNGYVCYLDFRMLPYGPGGVQYTYIHRLRIYNENTLVYTVESSSGKTDDIFSPQSIVFDYTEVASSPIAKVEIFLHYIRATLLTVSSDGVEENILNVGPYYEGMRAFEGSGLEVVVSSRTSEQSNGHRLIAGTDLYFAPPEGEGWIPLAEDNWNYASLWYKITPSPENGLQNRSLMGTWRWTRCWTLGTVLRYLLAKVSGGKVHFGEDEYYSQFLYAAVNPVAQGEQFAWLFCQKSDVMNPGGGNATRCPARLNWFLEYMKNALNCYWWLEKRNDGDYDFRLEHVEYFRRGNSYTDPLDDPMREFIDITKIKPLRNFPRNGQAAKRLSDQTNKYSFDLQGMAERYTFSWQGEGGSDEFKGNPMLFKAGWIEAGSSEDKQVDNIFADLSWLTLNAGTDTASSKNYEGLMVFAGYRKVTPVTAVTENAVMTERYLRIQQGSVFKVDMTLVVMVPEGQEFTVEMNPVLPGPVMWVGTYHGTGAVQSVQIVVDLRGDVLYTLRVDFGTGYGDVTLHRIHNNLSGNVYAVPNTESELTEGVYLQNGPLAWPSLQVAYLHYDVPAYKWALNSDDPADEATEWRDGGTVKLIKKQEVPKLPVPDLATEQRLKEGIRTGLGTGILDSATVNLGSRNAEMTLVYDITPLVS